MEFFDGIILTVNSATLIMVLRVSFLLGQFDQKHKDHERRLTKLENKSC